jgi:putative transposase
MILELIVPGRGSFMSSASPSYKGHRYPVGYPVGVIAHAVWLYFRFPLSYREVEELMLERGVLVSYETVRRWSVKFGQAYANGLRRRRPRPGDKWHLDEVFVRIGGKQKYLWRAVDQDGNVLDILLQSRRDAKAAKRFMVKLMKKQRRMPRVLVTEKLRSYSAAHREVMPSVEHRSHKSLNNRAENSHQPTRQRERAMKGFRSIGGAQRFLSAFSGISPDFRPRRRLMTATRYRAEMAVRFAIWDQITGAVDQLAEA